MREKKWSMFHINWAPFIYFLVGLVLFLKWAENNEKTRSWPLLPWTILINVNTRCMLDFF